MEYKYLGSTKHVGYKLHLETELAAPRYVKNGDPFR